MIFAWSKTTIPLKMLKIAYPNVRCCNSEHYTTTAASACCWGLQHCTAASTTLYEDTITKWFNGIFVTNFLTRKKNFCLLLCFWQEKKIRVSGFWEDWLWLRNVKYILILISVSHKITFKYIIRHTYFSVFLQ